MKKLTVLVGPPGSGKSTLAKEYVAKGYSYINQDSQGKEHMALFTVGISAGADIVVDRMGFNKNQRERYLNPAKEAGYETEIVVLHQSYEVCLMRCLEREGHETIKDEKNARAALNLFFTQYQRPEYPEANVIRYIYPDSTHFPKAIICDLDGTLCNIDHRLHFVKPPAEQNMLEKLGFKKDWKGFFDGMSEDEPNRWCKEILHSLGGTYAIVLCSGRPDNYAKKTEDWLAKHSIVYDDLLMRNRGDQRQDNIVKEIILDFEILTRYVPHFMIDDRAQVVDMWRKRGYTCLQCAKGDF